MKMKIKHEVSKKMLEEYEIIRSSGAANMFDYALVMFVASRIGADELSALTYDEYGDFLVNFNKNMKKFKVKQGRKKNE